MIFSYWIQTNLVLVKPIQAVAQYYSLEQISLTSEKLGLTKSSLGLIFIADWSENYVVMKAFPTERQPRLKPNDDVLFIYIIILEMCLIPY